MVEGLSAAAHRLLQNIEHASPNLPGSQEARRMMRFDTQALRILYGVPVFVTFLPDESHMLLMIRYARTHQHDYFCSRVIASSTSNHITPKTYLI